MVEYRSEDDLFVAGHTACAGCGAAIIVRNVMRALGKDVIIVNATSCLEIFSSCYPQSAWKVPYIHVTFENAAAVATGIAKTLEAKGNDHTKTVVISGDGATYDIGIGIMSGAMERNENILYICYDNEAYMNCLSKSTMIMTKKGLRKITEIKIGDEVYAFDQKQHKPVLKKCTGVFENGVRPIYNLETLHHSIKGTPNHPFLILQRNGRGKKNCFVWKTLSKLKEGDEIIILKRLNNNKSVKFNFKKVQKGDYKVNRLNEINIPEYSNPNLMKYLGLYLGDGWVRPKKGELGFALPKGFEGRKALVNIHSRIFGNSINTNDKIYVYVNSVNLARFIDSLGFGSGARNKKIAPWVFTLPQEEKQAFIDGLMLSDGYQIGNSMRYVSASFEFLKGLKLLLQTMNYRVGKIHQQLKKKGEYCVYRPLLKDSIYGHICFSKRKQLKEKYISQYKVNDFLVDNEYFSTEKIRKIKYIGKESVLDLRVEDAHNFIADGIVVHNTGIQRSSATPYKAWTTTSQIGKKIKGKQEPKKNLTEIVRAHGIPYAATSTAGHITDLQRKVTKAKEIKGFRFINVLSPCVAGWKYDPSLTVKLSKLAVETGLWKVYEVEDGKETVNIKPNFVPVEEYLKLQKRFKHLTPEDIKTIQENVNKYWKR